MIQLHYSDPDLVYTRTLNYITFDKPVSMRELEETLRHIYKLTSIEVSGSYLQVFKFYFENVPWLGSSPKSMIWYGDIAKTIMATAIQNTFYGHPILNCEKSI